MTDRPGILRLLAQEGQRQPSGVVRDMQDKLDAALANGHDPDNGVLALPGVVSETGLKLPDGLTFEQWQGVGFTLKRINKAWRWWVGDWLNYGEAQYGEMYSQAIEETGLHYNDLAQCAHVARKIEPAMRHAALGWSSHAAVAKLDKSQAAYLLDRATEEGWNRLEIRNAAKLAKAGQELVPAETLSSICSCGCHAGNCPKCGCDV